MKGLCRTVLAALLCLASAPALSGQEKLDASRIRARIPARLKPVFGYPVPKDGEAEPVVMRRDGRWFGAERMQGPHHWDCWDMRADSTATPTFLAPFLEEARRWAAEKPQGPVTVACGPMKGSALWFVALCARANSYPGFKSIAFLVPEHLPAGSPIYMWSCSVNALEHRTGYDFFNRLPGSVQEIVEEISASELLCPFQETEFELEREHPEDLMDRETESDYER